MDPRDQQDAEDRRLWGAARRGARTAGPCPDANDLAAWLDGRADQAAAERIESHLAVCPACVQAIGELRQLSQGGAMFVPPQVLARAKALVPARGRSGVWLRAGRWAAAAAAAAVVSLAGWQAGSATVHARRTVDSQAAAQLSFGLESDDSLLNNGDLLAALEEGAR